MKAIIVICSHEVVGRTIVAQIRKMFGDRVTVSHCCLHDAFAFEPSKVLAVTTGRNTTEHRKVQEKIAQGMECLVARRAVDFTRIQQLLQLPEGEEVLFVNDFEATTQDAIDHLRRIGLDHLVYHPYFPGIREFPPMKLAVTPGETALVPACVERTIDIGNRVLDISTIMDMVKRLGLVDELGDEISAQHLQEITRLLREVHEASKQVSRMRDTLQVIADHTPNGILYADLAGKVVLGNQTLSEVLGMSPGEMVNRSVAELVPGLAEAPDALEANSVVTLHGQDMIVREKAVSQGDGPVGRIYAFETGHAIQTLEYELRRRSRMSEHEARYTFGDIITKSPLMKQILAFAQRVAKRDSTILIQG
ncbi:MAG TPA: PAS domain S-box protein, partial [Holophaga sp.]|nr:PAS domain S-box protein [Holophaga sp.]